MRQTFCFAAIVFFMLSSCSKDDAKLSDNQTVGTLSDTGAITNGGIPFSNIFSVSLPGESLYNSCTGEVITIVAGNIIIDVHGVYNENNSIIFVQTRVEGVTATGRSGMLYTLTGSYNEQTGEYNNAVFTTRLQHFDRLIEPGSHNNAIVKSTYFIRIDAAGKVTLIKEPVSEVYCRMAK